MSLTKFIKNLQKRYEAIPAPGAIIYNATAAKILQKPERKIANDIVEKIGSGTLLDLGSGTGYLSIEIAKKAPSLQVYGVDLSKQMVKIARRHAAGIENVQFVMGNVAELPFEDDSIDFIVSTASFHHWKKPTNVFEGCYRVLKMGKEAWIYDACPDALKDGADAIKKEYGSLGYQFGIRIAELHGYTKGEYENEITDILDHTRFKNNYQMRLTDIWMKITLKSINRVDEQHSQNS